MAGSATFTIVVSRLTRNAASSSATRIMGLDRIGSPSKRVVMPRSPGGCCSSADAITGTGECLGPDHIWVPQVGRQDLMPRALAPDPRPLDTDPLHWPHLLGRPPHRVVGR